MDNKQSCSVVLVSLSEESDHRRDDSPECPRDQPSETAFAEPSDSVNDAETTNKESGMKSPKRKYRRRSGKGSAKKESDIDEEFLQGFLGVSTRHRCPRMKKGIIQATRRGRRKGGRSNVTPAAVQNTTAVAGSKSMRKGT